MSLIIKAFLEKGGNTKAEIRRFGIPADVSSSYTYLFEKISSIFPSLKKGNFNLYWKDGDGDLIRFSSDEELMDALSSVTDGTLKIYLRDTSVPFQTKENPGQSNTPTGVVHPHVICDGCDGAIYGIRYKCCVCHDYDLCSQCESRNLHPEHNMLKIVSPHPPQSWPFMGPPHPHFWMNRWMRGRCGRRSGRCHRRQQQKEEEKQSSEEQAELGPEENYLQQVGQSVAEMLDPFGIQVSFDIEHEGRRCSFRAQNKKHGSDSECQKQGEQMSDECSPSTSSSSSSGEEPAPQQTATPAQQMETEKMDIFEDGHVDGEVPQSQTNSSQTNSSQTASSMRQILAPHIAQARKQMLEMGFNDDNGWLTYLLVSKDGNIPQVLDAFKTNRQGSHVSADGYMA